MTTVTDHVVSRRLALGGIAVAAVGVAAPRQARARAILQRGMVGGGLAKFELSEAQFSLVASRLTFDDGTPDAIVGSVIWVDAQSGFTFVSTAITDYQVVEDAATAGEIRRILGTMRVNDGETYPFSLTVTDADLPGSGQDSVALLVGDGAMQAGSATPAAGTGFSYAAAGPITVGDVQDVDFDITPGAPAGSATPAA